MANIHPQLSAACITLGWFPLSHLLLMNDSNYPWFILVPQRDNIREIYQLESTDRAQLLNESCLLSEFLMTAFNGEKLNIAALGNLVPQLHLHHIVRFQTDVAWPEPVWGKVPTLTYSDSVLDEIKSKLANANLESFTVAGTN